MNTPLTSLPQFVPMQKERVPQRNIPQTREDRERVRTLTKQYVDTVGPVPPLAIKELREHTRKIIVEHDLPEIWLDYMAVLLNSEAWRGQLAAVPYERRLLLLPKCLRIEEKCPAPFDEFGLLCKRCGLCSIQDLQEEAEKLGYAVLVAEGSALVMALLQTGKIDAIVGVSCLAVLEKAPRPHPPATAPNPPWKARAPPHRQNRHDQGCRRY